MPKKRKRLGHDDSLARDLKMVRLKLSGMTGMAIATQVQAHRWQGDTDTAWGGQAVGTTDVQGLTEPSPLLFKKTRIGEDAMSDHKAKKYGRIEVKRAGGNERESTYQILHRGHKVATYTVSWDYEGGVDDLDMEVIGEATVTSLRNAQRLADDIVCSLRLDRQNEEAEAVLSYFLLSPVSGVPARDRSALSELFLEDEFLRRVKEDGPLALRNYRIQASLDTLLERGDKRTGEAIRGVLDALLEYAKVEKLPGKRGKVRYKSLGKAVVKKRYRELDGILTIAKEKANSQKRKPKKDDIRGLMFEARMKYYEDNGIEVSNLPSGLEDDGLLDWSPVSDLLVNDKEFTAEFLSFNWEPGKFAICIIGNFLGYTFETMDRYL